MLMDNIELEPVSPFSNRQPCFQLSHLIVGIRRSLFWSTRLLQKSKRGAETYNWFLQLLVENFTPLMILTSDDDHLFWREVGMRNQFQFIQPSKMTPFHCCSATVKVITSSSKAQSALVLNWKADLQPTQLFKCTCALWSGVHNLESANSLWRKRRAFENKMSTVKSSAVVLLVFIGL